MSGTSSTRATANRAGAAQASGSAASPAQGKERAHEVHAFPPQPPLEELLGGEGIGPLSLEVMRYQPTINVGTIGHVAHGKTTLVKVTGVNSCPAAGPNPVMKPILGDTRRSISPSFSALSPAGHLGHSYGRPQQGEEAGYHHQATPSI
jgi:hypothetical protein